MLNRPSPSAPDPGPVAYVLKMFPRLSETFVTNEISEMLRHGVDVRIISLLRPTGTIQSKEALDLKDRVCYLPRITEGGGLSKIIRDHRWIAKRDLPRYLRILLVVGRRFSRSAWKRFFQAGPVARFCLESGVAHLHGGFAHVPTSVAWWASRMSGIPFSFAAHAKDLYLSNPRSIRHKMDAARFVCTCTLANRDYLLSLGSKTPVHVGYHGSDLTVFTPRPSPPDGPRTTPRILAVGRLVPKKGFDDLLRAARLLRERMASFEIVLVGDGIERAALETLAGELGVKDRVRFLGSLPPIEVRQEYLRADLLVIPSVLLENGDRDGIPNVLVEAMAMGVPVIGTNISGIPELVRHEETGLLVPPRRPQELARAIEQTLSDRTGARKRAELAVQDVRERFDLRRNSGALAELLNIHRHPTRCLYVTTDLGVPVRGHKGASAHVRQVAGHFAEAGLDVRVVTPAPGPEPPAGNRFDLPIVEVPPPRWVERLMERTGSPRIRQALRELRRLLHNIPLRNAVTVLLKELHPDFVYERYALCAFATGLACRRRRIPWLLEVNAPLAEEEDRFRVLQWKRLTRFIERWIMRHADHLFVVSHHLRRWALEQGVDPDRVSVLPNGVDTKLFNRGVDGGEARRGFGWGEGEMVVAFSGSLKPWHGGLSLLDAFEQAHARNGALRLVFIGDGPERKKLERHVRRHRLEQVVRFTGSLSQDRVPAMLRAADLLVAPYLHQERFYFSPMKILEYMGVGRPVIAPRLGDIPDLIDSTCGLLYNPGSRRELRDAILTLASDEDRRSKMGSRAFHRASEEGWSRRVDTILGTVRTLREIRPTTRPRIGYVLKMFPRFSETFIVNEIIELERQGLEVRVFSMKVPQGKRQPEADRVHARTTVLPTIRTPFPRRMCMAHLRCVLRRPRRYLGALHFALGRRDRRALVKFLQAGVVADIALREKIGHFHAHFASGPTRIAKMSSMISGIPFSFTAHAKDIYWEGHNHADSHKLKKRIKLARFVVAISRENKRFLENLGFRVKEGRIRSIHIGLRLDDFPFTLPSARPRSPRPLILAVGRLIEKKGFHILLDALHHLQGRGIRFRCFIAGDGPLRESLAARLRELNLEGTVRLLGAVPLDRLRARYYSRARVLVQPSIIAADGDRDGIPTVLLESMALGVPIVSTPVSGIPEAVDSGRDGFLTDPGDPAAVAEAIGRILGDVELADRIACAARQRIERQFDVRKNAGALRKLFLRSLKGWPPPEGPTRPPAVSFRPASERSKRSARESVGIT